MKILHTSDWHLGQKFLYYDREQEHQLALDWLVDTIINQSIDTLLIAGDIFDIGNPPNYARLMYYNFLKKLLNTQCRHIVIIGGNHDSPSMLNAPKALLQILNVHVIGAATDRIEDEIIELKDEKGRLEAVVSAVPFLRDRDLRASATGESGLERIDRIKEGIYRHYSENGELMKPFKKKEVPIIAMGHLYAKGAQASEKQDNIYIGNMENINAEQFPSIYDYVALGHIHRAQKVGGQNHIRYCGSIIPLSFSEVRDEKAVFIVNFEKNNLGEIEHVPIPVFRRLKTLEGSLEKVQEGLELVHKKNENKLPAWVEVIIETEEIIPNLDGLLHDFTKEMNLELLKIRMKRKHLSLDIQVENVELDDLKPIEVFQKKCASAGNPPEEIEELIKTFKELEAFMLEE